MIDPHSIDKHSLGKTTWMISQRIRTEAVDFRKALPRDCKLLVALSPVPAEMASQEYISTHSALLLELARLVGGKPLFDLPATLPASCCASSTHLNQIGRKRYSALLAKSLEPIILK